MKRINVIGTSGTGKSTFSRKLAKAHGYPYIEMDAVFWRPNWEETDNEKFLADIKEKVSGTHWVLDGNYSRTEQVKWKYADTVIWLDYGFVRNFSQIMYRSIIRAITKKEIWPGTGNHESFRKTFFTKQSIVLWMLTHYRSNRLRYATLMGGHEYPHLKFIRVRSPKEAAKIVQIAGSN